MTITLTKAIREAGSSVAAGTTITRAADVEADIVARGFATPVGLAPGVSAQGNNLALTQAAMQLSETASKTLSIQDSGQYLICNSASAIALTVPSDATAGWTGAVTIAACRKGVGAVTFAAGDGVTLRGDLATPARYGSKGIVRIGTNEWTVIA